MSKSSVIAILVIFFLVIVGALGYQKYQSSMIKPDVNEISAPIIKPSPTATPKVVATKAPRPSMSPTSRNSPPPVKK